MRQGKVKWYNGKKCFGFITPDAPNADGNTDDVFVHSSALKDAGIRFWKQRPQRDEESARRFHERRAESRRSTENRKSREERTERRGFAFWKK